MAETFLSRLAERIWATPQFHTERSALHASSVVKGLMGDIPAGIPDEAAVQKLLQAATVLAASTAPAHRQAAYRVAVDAFSLYGDQLPNLPNLLHVIFGRLGNFPAVDHLYRTLRQEKQYAIPSGVLHELVEHESANMIAVGGTEVVLTDFQHALWQSLDKDAVVSVSAPTSAGKSFALQQYLVNALLTDKLAFVLYLVPTRALIHQVSDALSSAIAHVTSDVLVSTIPQTPSELGMERGVFVLTQERAHVLLEADKALRFQMVIVDEAQTIGEGARGILLQVVMERLVRDNSKAQFFLGSPFSGNPDHFSYLFQNTIQPVKEVTSPVSQNLIFTDIGPVEANKLKLSLGEDDGRPPIQLAELALAHDVQGDEPTFAYLSYWFGQHSKNLVYSGSPAKCEDIADKIRQWKETIAGVAQPSNELQEFATLVREHIHKDYQLADMIEHGIAFHYGKMPTLLRKAIEYYFANNDDMRFLVCTSTLLHGVNLPARNLFILKPSEGDRWLTRNAQPMRSPSFWNLAGRAGRLGKDFEGNVFLVNKAQWDSDPTEGDKEHTIRSSLYETVRAHHDDIVRLANSEEMQADAYDQERVESAFVKLFCDFRRERLGEVVAHSPVDIPEDFVARFSDACNTLTFTVPDEIIEDNVALSPFRQQRMLDYMQTSIARGDHAKLIPPHPQAADPDPYQMYIRLLSRYERYFDGRARASQMPRYLAAIALAWMRGTPYPQIIQEGQRRNPNKGLPTVIRDLMETIENRLRFKAVQQTRCYLDLLRHALEANDLGNLVASIPAIPLYLELGACSGTMVNLIGLGISRTTAGLLNAKAANRSMDRGQCVAWLLRENWEASDLPKVCINEVRTVLAGSLK